MLPKNHDPILQFLEILIRLLLTHLEGRQDLADDIYEQYTNYTATSPLRTYLDPERAFATGIIMLFLGRFDYAISTLQDAIEFINDEYNVSPKNPLVRYHEYLIIVYVNYLRERRLDAKNDIQFKDISHSIEILDKALIDSEGKENDFLYKRYQGILALAYEAASRYVCLMKNGDSIEIEQHTVQLITPRLRKSLVERYFTKAKTFYQQAFGDNLPDSFKQWEDELIKYDFCG